MINPELIEGALEAAQMMADAHVERLQKGAYQGEKAKVKAAEGLALQIRQISQVVELYRSRR